MPCLQSVRLKTFQRRIEMNANELADYLDNSVEAMLISEQIHIDQAATMLRQQQTEIETLNRFIEERGETGQLIMWKAQKK